MTARTALLRFSVDADHLTPRLAGVLRALSRKTLQSMLDPYRPELHYMRGPGPRWYAKHGQSQPAPGNNA
jgi:hypothetical protein